MHILKRLKTMGIIIFCLMVPVGVLLIAPSTIKGTAQCLTGEEVPDIYIETPFYEGVAETTWVEGKPGMVTFKHKAVIFLPWRARVGCGYESEPGKPGGWRTDNSTGPIWFDRSVTLTCEPPPPPEKYGTCTTQ